MSGEEVYVGLLIDHGGQLLRKHLDGDLTARLLDLQKVLGATNLEAVAMPEGRYLLIDADGKNGLHFINGPATQLAHDAKAIAKDDYIAGMAILVPKEAIA